MRNARREEAKAYKTVQPTPRGEPGSKQSGKRKLKYRDAISYQRRAARRRHNEICEAMFLQGKMIEADDTTMSEEEAAALVSNRDNLELVKAFARATKELRDIYEAKQLDTVLEEESDEDSPTAWLTAHAWDLRNLWGKVSAKESDSVCDLKMSVSNAKMIIARQSINGVLHNAFRHQAIA